MYSTERMYRTKGRSFLNFQIFGRNEIPFVYAQDLRKSNPEKIGNFKKWRNIRPILRSYIFN